MSESASHHPEDAVRIEPGTFVATRSRKLVGWLLTAAIVTAGASTVSPTGAAAGANHSAITPVGGSAHYLVYSKFVVDSTGHRAPTGGLFVQTLHGKSRRLGSVTKSASGFSMSKSMLVYRDHSTDPSGPQRLHWVDVRSGDSGHAAVDVSTESVAAGPDGWYTESLNGGPGRDSWVLRFTSRAGATHTIGRPEPRRQRYNLASGPTALAIYQAAPSGATANIKLMSFSHPGRFRTLLAKHHVLTSDCESVTAGRLACVTTGAHSGAVRVYRVSDGQLLWRRTPSCVGLPAAVLHHATAWVTPNACAAQRDRLWTVTRSGQIHKSHRPFAVGSAVAAFDGAVVARRGQRRLIYFNRPQHSRVLVNVA